MCPSRNHRPGVPTDKNEKVVKTVLHNFLEIFRRLNVPETGRPENFVEVEKITQKHKTCPYRVLGTVRFFQGLKGRPSLPTSRHEKTNSSRSSVRPVLSNWCPCDHLSQLGLDRLPSSTDIHTRSMSSRTRRRVHRTERQTQGKGHSGTQTRSEGENSVH